MEELKRYAYILKLLEKIEKPVGKTFIQKGIYLIQEGLGEKIDYKFKLHFYGPYSSELSSDLSTLESWDMIKINSKPEYGYEVSITQKGRQFLARKEDAIKIDEENVLNVIKLIGDSFVREMELLGTTLYFAKVAKTEKEIPGLVKMVKPQFDEKDVKGALKKLNERGIPLFHNAHSTLLHP